MGFIVRMAARDLRASWRRLLFFFVCVALGVGAIVALRSIIQSIQAGLVSEARTMLASDVQLQTNRPWTPAVRARIAAVLSEAPVEARSESIETATMVRGERADVARMVELRGIDAAFPFYGTLTLGGGQTYAPGSLAGRGALVGPELLAQLGLAVGDRLVIGGQPFTVRGVIAQEPGRRVGAFTLGARVLVDAGDLQSTGLLSFGSRASYQILLKVRDDGVARLTGRFRRELRDDFVNARSYKALEDDIGEDLGRAENYLSLVGFVILVLGGIGVWSVTRVFVRQKIKSVAILKCLGASTRQVLGIYVLEVMLLGLAGSVLGVALAGAAIASVPAAALAAFGNVSYGLTRSAVLQGLAVGILVSLLFALVPLLEVRRVKPLLLLRGADLGGGPAASRSWRRSLGQVDWLQVTVAVLVGAALTGVASWQAASWRAGAIVSGGFAAVTLVLWGAAWLLVRATAPLGGAPWFPLRYAVRGLRRPGNQTRVILLSVGLGSFFVLGVRALQDNLVSEAALDLRQGSADLFLLDVQRDQVGGVQTMLAAHQPAGSSPPRLVPTLRARVTGVQGRELNLENYADVRGRGALAREYTITYRDTLEQNESIVDGRFWGPGPPAAGDVEEVSVEEGLHQRFDINVGDLMRFDVLGRPIEARVSSIRRVVWEDARSGGFMFVFRPGALAQAPHTFVGFARGPTDPSARGRLQHDLVAAYPNVSAIDAREIIARIQTIVDNVILAITVVGGVALLSGVLILIGAVGMTRFQRVYESAILRTLGAGTRLLATIVALEYCALGLLAGVIGAAGALVLSWAVTRYLFDIPWDPAPVLLTAGALLTAALVAIVGLIASLDVLRLKPLGTLREGG